MAARSTTPMRQGKVVGNGGAGVNVEGSRASTTARSTTPTRPAPSLATRTPASAGSSGWSGPSSTAFRGAATITNAYAAGLVSQTGTNVGGFAGMSSRPRSRTATGTQDRAGVTAGVGAGSAAGVTALAGANAFTLSSYAGFTPSATAGAPGNAWVIVDVDGTLNNAGAAAGGTMPMLASEAADGRADPQRASTATDGDDAWRETTRWPATSTPRRQDPSPREASFRAATCGVRRVSSRSARPLPIPAPSAAAGSRSRIPRGQLEHALRRVVWTGRRLLLRASSP